MTEINNKYCVLCENKIKCKTEHKHNKQLVYCNKKPEELYTIICLEKLNKKEKY